MVKRIVFIVCISVCAVISNAQIELKDLELSPNNSMIEFDGNLWIFGPGPSSANNPATYNALKSEDGGENWTIEIPNNGTLYSSSITVNLNGTLISVAGHPTIVTNEVKVSTDGINWSTHVPPFSARADHAVVVHNNKAIMVGGSGASHTANNDVWATTNGIDWVQQTNQISTVFPHFDSPKLVSLNGKLVLFGGFKNGFAYPKNDRGVYISEDDGATWTRYEFPYDAALTGVKEYFVYENRLWVKTRVKIFADNSDASTINRTGNRYFSSADGINWKLESGHIPTSSRGGSKITSFNNEILIFYRAGNHTTKNTFNPSPIQVTHSFGILNHITPNTSIDIPFNIDSNHASNGFDLCFSSNNQAIIPVNNISWNNNTLSINPTNISGECIISINITDGVNNHTEHLLYYNYPEANVDIYQIPNKRIDVNGDANGIRVFTNHLAGYGSNNFSFTSSDNTVVDASTISIYNIGILSYLDLSGFDVSVDSEVEITIMASDGSTSDTESFWIKVGADEAPVLYGTLDDITITTGESIDFTMPAGTFTDPEAEPLYYSADNLPCGFNLDPATGNISGSSTDDLPYNIIIIAKDKYGQTAEVPLNILDATTDIEDDFENESHVSLYPNPVSDVFTIESTENIEYIRIYNMVGSMVYQQEIDATSAYINPELLSGNYIVEIHTQTDNRILKMTVR